MAKTYARHAIAGFCLAWTAMTAASADPGSRPTSADEAPSSVPVPPRADAPGDAAAIAAYVAQVDGQLRGGQYKRLEQQTIAELEMVDP